MGVGLVHGQASQLYNTDGARLTKMLPLAEDLLVTDGAETGRAYFHQGHGPL